MGTSRLTGVMNMFRARLGGWRSVEDAAVAIEILEEKNTEEIPPPAMLPDMPERIASGVPGFTTAAKEREILTSREINHGPLVRYTLTDCLVHDGGVEYQGGLWPKTRTWKDRLPIGSIEDVAEGSYCMNRTSHEYFGHWLRDACATALLADDKDVIFLDDRPDWPDAAHYASAFGLPTRRARAALVSTMRLYSDPWLGQLRRQRYATLRRRAQERFPPHSGSARPIYLRRGSTGNRREIQNESELCRRLASEGFEILDLASHDFAERFGRLANAPVVVSLEGSHLNHAHFAMKAGSAVLALIPGARPSAIHRIVSHAMGMRFGCVVLESAGSDSVVNPDEVMRTLDLLT